MQQISTEELKNGIATAMEMTMFPGASEADNRPMLGLPPNFYYILHELSHLFYRRPLSFDDTAALNILEEKLLNLQNSVLSAPRETLGVADGSVTEHVRLGRLYCLAGLMLAARLQVASLAILESDVFFISYRAEAVRLIDVRAMLNAHGKFDSTWPLVVIGCMCRDPLHIALIRESMKILTKTTGEQSDKLLWSVLEEIWRGRQMSPNGQPVYVQGEVDELELLASCYNKG